MRPDEIRPGGLVAGKFRIRTILGRGHGVLVEAFNTEFDQRVAIRLLLPGQTDDQELERFRREARTLAKLESEHVARIIDVATQPDGTFCLVRQFLEGTDLVAYLRTRGRLSLQEASLLVLQAAEAVAETHGHGIILREMQPQHLFVTTRAGGSPILKIIDFGTSKLMRDVAGPGGGEMTATTVVGLSAYASPEVLRKAKTIDVRADVWSLGALLYFVLTGRPPFDGDMATLLLQITKEAPQPVTQLRPDLPREIDQVIGWSMAKDSEGRFANVHGFAHALRTFVTAEGQVLIDRIGAITHAAANKRKTGSVPPPPPAATLAQAVEEDDDDGEEATQMMNMSSLHIAPGGDAPMERTMFLAGDFVPSSPAPPVKPPRPAAGGGAVSPQPSVLATSPPVAGAGPKPAPAFPGQNPGLGAAPQLVIPPSPRLPTLPAEAARPALPAWAARSAGADPATPSGSVFASSDAASPFAAPKADKRIVIGVIAAVALLIPTLLAIVFVGGGDSHQPVATASDDAGPMAVNAPSSNVAPGQTTATPTGEHAADPANQPPAAGATASSPSTAAGDSVAANPPTNNGASPPRAGAGNGMLVAVAVGGICAFSVDGAAKGTTSQVKLSMPPGTYAVSCRPSTGITRSRSVVVKSGETAMATFKLK